MSIEDNLKSDDIEIVKLYVEILLKKKGTGYVNKILAEENNYKIITKFDKYFLQKPNRMAYSFVGSASVVPSYLYPYEEIELSYKPKKKKVPVFNNFLIPKNTLKYVNRRNVRK